MFSWFEEPSLPLIYLSVAVIIFNDFLTDPSALSYSCMFNTCKELSPMLRDLLASLPFVQLSVPSLACKCKLFFPSWPWFRVGLLAVNYSDCIWNKKVECYKKHTKGMVLLKKEINLKCWLHHLTFLAAVEGFLVSVASPPPFLSSRPVLFLQSYQ